MNNWNQLSASEVLLSKKKPNNETKSSRVANSGKSRLSERVVIVGAGEAAAKLAKDLTEHSNGRCMVVGFVDNDEELAKRYNLKLLGKCDDLQAIVEEHDIDEVLVVYHPSWLDRFMRESTTSHKTTKVRLIPGIFESMICRLSFEHLNDAPVISVGIKEPSSLRLFEKRCLDIAVSLVTLILTSPLMLLAAIAIKLTSPGPVFYKQIRVGRNGKLFNIYKFRSMMQNAEQISGPVFASPNDPRITRVGAFLRKTRLDELPQLVNVILGHISCVGPRPERPEFIETFNKTIPGYSERHRVKPGITGLAQVLGYYMTDVHTKLRYDIIYINHISLLLDLRILWSTIRVVVLDRKG